MSARALIEDKANDGGRGGLGEYFGLEDHTGTYIYLLVLKPLLDIIVDSFVCDSTEQGHIWHTGRLLLLESFTPVRFGYFGFASCSSST